MKLKLMLLAFLVSFGAFSQAEVLEWSFTNKYYDTVQIKFYSQTYNRVWPGRTTAWPIYSGQVQDYRLTCTYGEKICYGAWDPDIPDSKNWGVYNNTKGCKTCCRTCGADPSETTLVD